MQHNSQGPDITFLAVNAIIVGFRGHISGRPNIITHLSALCAGHLAVAKIDDGRLIVSSKQNIICF